MCCSLFKQSCQNYCTFVLQSITIRFSRWNHSWGPEMQHSLSCVWCWVICAVQLGSDWAVSSVHTLAGVRRAGHLGPAKSVLVWLGWGTVWAQHCSGALGTAVQANKNCPVYPESPPFLPHNNLLSFVPFWLLAGTMTTIIFCVWWNIVNKYALDDVPASSAL